MNGSVNKMKYNFIRKLNNAKVVSAGVSLVILLSSCSINSNINNSTTRDVVVETSQSTVQNTTLNSAIETESSADPESTLEPFECDARTLSNLATYMQDLGYSKYSNNLPFTIGYDNPYMSQLINEYMSSIDSEYTNLTAEDFNYFSCENDQLNYFGNTGDWQYNFEEFGRESMPIIQAILIENNLRMMIDEIPYTYFEQRFPEFVADQSAEYQEGLYNQYYDILVPRYDEQNNTFDMTNLTDYEYDIVLYYTARSYNTIRSLFMYSGHVDQIREESTGRNILVPSESKLDYLNENFGFAVGGDVTQVETREHFYETYGMYPEDALYRETRYEGNLTESNSMYSEAPSRQR